MSANFYGASFSPKIYPGQQLHARLYLPAGGPDQVYAGLYVWDDNARGGRQSAHQAAATRLQPGQWTELTFSIPAMDGALLSEVGVALHNLGENWTGLLLLDDIDWRGQPSFSYDFSKEHPEYGAASQWTFLRGYWRLHDGGYHGSGPEISETYSGDPSWEDYTLSAQVTPLVGSGHFLLARVQGARRSYVFGLSAGTPSLAGHHHAGDVNPPAGDVPGGRLVLYKNAGGYYPVAEVPFAWKLGIPYVLHLKVAGNCLTAWVAGGPRIEWTDPQAPFLTGQIGLANQPGCHTRFDAVRLS